MNTTPLQFYPAHPSGAKTHQIETTAMPMLEQDAPFEVKTLCDEFNADADRFFATYTDKRFAVTGIAKKIGPDIHHKPSIELSDSANGKTYALLIFPTDDHYSKVAVGDNGSVPSVKETNGSFTHPVQRIARGIVGDGSAVVGSELIFPVGIAVAIGYSTDQLIQRAIRSQRISSLVSNIAAIVVGVGLLPQKRNTPLGMFRCLMISSQYRDTSSQRNVQFHLLPFGYVY